MEKAFLISSAALLVVYFIITETLDWVGRIEVIRDHFPRFPEFFERRTFRVALLLVAIALLIRVATERDGKKVATAPPSPTAQAVPAPEAKKSEPPQNQPDATPQVKPIPNAKRPKAPSIAQTHVAPTPQDNSVHIEHGSKIEQHSSGECSPNMIGGSGIVNCAPQPRIPNGNIDRLSAQLALCSSGSTTAIPNVVNPTGTTERDAQNLATSFAKTRTWRYSGVGHTIKGQDIGPDGPIRDPVGVHISSDASHEPLATCVKDALKSIGVESVIDFKQDQGDSLSILVGNIPN